MAEFNLGTLNTTPKLKRDFVGDNDTSDVFSFSLGAPSNLNLSLTGMTQDAELRLYQDIDGNGKLDKNIDALIDFSLTNGNSDESLNNGSRIAGKYLAEVERFAGANTNYQLKVSATDPDGTSNSTSQTRASNLLPTEVNVGVNSISFSKDGAVGNLDTADVYRFQATKSGNFHLAMTGLSADADVRLIQDFNFNGVVDSGDVIGSSTRSGTNSEAIDANLTAGVDYFVQVYQFSGVTSYHLEGAIQI